LTVWLVWQVTKLTISQLVASYTFYFDFCIIVLVYVLSPSTVKPVFFACPLFRKFREPGKFAKIMGRENLNTVAFQCSRKQKRQNYGVQNNYIDSNAKIKGSTVHQLHLLCNVYMQQAAWCRSRGGRAGQQGSEQESCWAWISNNEAWTTAAAERTNLCYHWVQQCHIQAYESVAVYQSVLVVAMKHWLSSSLKFWLKSTSSVFRSSICISLRAWQLYIWISLLESVRWFGIKPSGLSHNSDETSEHRRTICLCHCRLIGLSTTLTFYLENLLSSAY